MKLRRKILGLAFSLMLGAPSFAASSSPVAAQDFLGANWMESDVHRVSPLATNNGQINTYVIETRHGVFRVNGTDQARAFIREIDAANTLRQKSTTGMVGSALSSRVVNLVKTPIKTVKSVGNRIDAVSNLEDAVLLAPRTAIDVGGSVLNGASEMVYTGNRLLKKAGGGSKCQGLGKCLEDAGEDVLSGMNSLAGKHNSARKLHAQFGTDSETRNPILKREVDRLAYAEAYTKTGFKLFAPNTGLSELDTYRRGVAVYNNGQLVANYKDAYRKRNQQKAGLLARGIDSDILKAFYKHDNYTKKQKYDLIESLNQLTPQANLAPFIQDASTASNVYEAKSYVDKYAYFAWLKTTRGIQDFKSDPIQALGPIALMADNHHAIPIKADLLDWTAETDMMMKHLSRFQNLEIHILGHATPELKQNARRIGVHIIELQ